jgi:cytidylate kinase
MPEKSGITVAIDGPAGAGKSTVAKRIAMALGYALVDTGAIYRAVALLASRAGIALDDDARLAQLVAGLDIDFRFEDGANHVFVSGEDVSLAIRAPEISMAASAVSARPAVRAGLLDLQRRLAGAGGAVLEGRDIGTVVFPDAPVKIFLDATAQERARRRHDELVARGEPALYDDVLDEVRRRDAQDAGRDVAPLKAADDAIIVDSTRMSIDDVVARVVGAVESIVTSRRG